MGGWHEILYTKVLVENYMDNIAHRYPFTTHFDVLANKILRSMTTWKHCERMVAKLLGGVRTGNNGESRRDVEHPHWSIEVKHRQKLPNWIHDAMGQAEREADGRVPIVVLHEKNLKYEESYVIMRLHTFNTETNYIDVEDIPRGPEITNGDD